MPADKKEQTFKKDDLVTSAFTGPDVLNTYDPFTLIHDSVPIGEYPDVTSDAIRDNKPKTKFQFE